MAAFDTSRPMYGSHSSAARTVSPLTALFAAFSNWNDARQTRNSLSRLSDRELEDIGLVRGDIDSVAVGRWAR